VDLTIEKLLGFALVLTRTSAFFLILPVFGAMNIPVNIKVAITVITAGFFTAAHSFGIDPSQVSPLEAVLLLSNEAIYGLAMGLIVTLVFAAVQVAGRIVERQMGLAMSNILDPMTGESVQPLGLVYEMIFILMFLAANGHHLFLLVLSQSYQAFPAGSMPHVEILSQGVVQAGATMLIAGLRLSAPLLAAFVLLLLVLAVLARVVPEMNILFISLSMKTAMGLLLATVMLPFLSGYVNIFADWMALLLPI